MYATSYKTPFAPAESHHHDQVVWILPLHRIVNFVILDRRHSQFWEISAMVTTMCNQPLRWFCGSLWKVIEYRDKSLMSLLAKLHDHRIHVLLLFQLLSFFPVVEI